MASYAFDPQRSPPPEHKDTSAVPTTASLLPRPIWLASGAELESLLATSSPEIQVSLCDLSSNKNNSDLVEKVLERILSVKAGGRQERQHRDSQDSKFRGSLSPKQCEETAAFARPTEYELLLARLHLAVEVQSIMVRWCLKGLEDTKRTNLLTRGTNLLNSLNESSMELMEEGERLRQTDQLEAKMVLDSFEHGIQPEIQQTGGTRSRSTSTTSSGSNTTIDSRKRDAATDTPTHFPSHEHAPKRRKVGENSASFNTLPKLSLDTASTITTPALTSAPGSQSAGPLKRKRDDLFISTSKYSPSTALLTPGSGISPKSNRQYAELSSPLSVTGTGEKSPYLCPFFILNPETHKECERKKFPNPRKLKEHIWRYTKPFKCPVCNEGFGREKTKAIHCQQRKTPCKPRPTPDSPAWDNSSTNGSNPATSYEGSKEQRRDQKIDAARSTLEIINILKEYEREAEKEAKEGESSSGMPSSSAAKSPSVAQQNFSDASRSRTSAREGENHPTHEQAVPYPTPTFQNPFQTFKQEQQRSMNRASPGVIFSRSQQTSSPQQNQAVQNNVPEIVVHSYDVNAMETLSSPSRYTPEKVQFRSPSPAPTENQSYGQSSPSASTIPAIQATNAMDGYRGYANTNQVPFFPTSSQRHGGNPSGMMQK